MRRCPDCGFRTEDKVCPLCGVRTRAVDIPVHTHTQKGETCALPNQKPRTAPVTQQEKPARQPSGEQSKYVRTSGKSVKGEMPIGQLLLIVIVLVAVMRACSFLLLS